MAQARIPMRKAFAAEPRHPGMPLPRAGEDDCEACHGSGEVWLLDRHAGAVWMACSCGAARNSDTAASWIAIVGYPCAAVGLCASVFFLL